MFHM